MTHGPKFQARHYEAIAATIKARVTTCRANVAAADMAGQRAICSGRLFESLLMARDTAAMFESDNSKFDRPRYLKACGMTETDSLWVELAKESNPSEYVGS